MSLFTSESWEWLKTAPLPVVLSLCMTSFFVLGSYAYSIDKDVQAQKAEVVVAKTAADKASAAAETARRVEEKIDKLADLLNAVILDREVSKARRDAAKAAKENK